jgi:hypothetical protein
MNFKSICTNFIKAMRALIRNLPNTAEQVEATNSVSWPIDHIVRLATELDTRFPGATTEAMAESFGAQFDEYVKGVTDEAVAQAEAKYSGYVSKDELGVAVAAAAEAARKEGRTEAMAEAAQTTEANKNRAKLIAAGIPEAAANKIPTADLVGANAEATEQRITGRVKCLREFIPELGELASACAEASDAQFDIYLATAKSAAALGKKKPGGNPLDGGGQQDAADAGGKKLFRL